jgi:hypothetical protein
VSSAAARLLTAASLAEHTEHAEIAAWCVETQAWQALTNGRFAEAADLSRAAQEIAPHDGSAFIQSTAQEARAWSRLGESSEAVRALARLEKLVSPKPVPDMPDHHFRYDPTKALTFTVTTLSWLADPAAESYARQVLALLESGREEERRPRRIATARIDLALVLTRSGAFDEAAGQAILALESGRIFPSSAWRAAEIVRAARAADVAQADDLHESFLLATGVEKL